MDILTIKNKKTGKAERIWQQDLTIVDWGFYFFVETELEAYKAAYAYRETKNGAKVDFAGVAQRWRVTVFNDLVADGIDIHG